MFFYLLGRHRGRRRRQGEFSPVGVFVLLVAGVSAVVVWPWVAFGVFTVVVLLAVAAMSHRRH